MSRTRLVLTLLCVAGCAQVGPGSCDPEPAPVQSPPVALETPADPPSSPPLAPAEPTRAAAPALRILPAADSCPPPAPSHGLLPSHRIVSFYGNPMTPRMGVLGLPRTDSMLARLERQAEAYHAVDPCTPVVRALHLVAVVAQPRPGPDGRYRTRAPDSLIQRVLDVARSNGALLILDVQPGRSAIADEIRALEPFLAQPDVHLALDPEFRMSDTQVPGRVIGSLDAGDVNTAIRLLADIAARHALPPRILAVHRFTRSMLTRESAIRTHPDVQLVLVMDGIGPPALKRHSYRNWVARSAIPFTGFKLFYQLDVPLMTPAQVLALEPRPVFIIYQ